MKRMLTVSLPLNKVEKRKIEIRARRHGFSVEEFFRFAIRAFMSVPEESLEDYRHPAKIRRAIAEGHRELQEKTFLTAL